MYTLTAVDATVYLWL